MVVAFCNISIGLMSFTVIIFMSSLGLVPYDSMSQNFWIKLSVDIFSANLLVTWQVDVLWFPPNKAQPNVLSKAIGLLFFPDYISVHRCKYWWSTPINIAISWSCWLLNGISLRWLDFLLTDDLVTGDVDAWRFLNNPGVFFCSGCWLHLH